MPLFDFKCPSCNRVVELLVRSPDGVVCTECGGEMVKLVSTPASPPRSGAVVARARAQAGREGHFSNYSAAERRGKG